MSLGVTTALPSKVPISQRRTIPFDYQFYLQIFDPKKETRSFLDQVVTATVTVSIEAAFVAVSVGYGFIPRVRTFAFGPEFDPTATLPPPGDLTFKDIVNAMEAKLAGRAPARVGGSGGEISFAIKTSTTNVDVSPAGERVLIQGIQINPALMPHLLHALQDNSQLTAGEFTELFQAVEPPPDRVQFLYALYDKGTGRSFQSEPLLSTSGLGISDGDRPFRYFATPIVFAPRSTIQLDVIPKTDFRGELYVTLHGYKVLGGVGTPTGHKLRGPAQLTRMRRR